MPFVVALLIWFAISLPASLIVGRVLAAANARQRALIPVQPTPTPPRRLVRS